MGNSQFFHKLWLLNGIYVLYVNSGLKPILSLVPLSIGINEKPHRIATNLYK